MKTSFFAAILFCTAAHADDAFVSPKSVSTAVRNSVAGSQIAVAYPNAKLKVLEEQDGWVKVELSGWIDKDDLRTAGSTATTAVTVGEKSPLVVDDFSIVELSKLDTKEKARVNLVLKLRNQSQTTIQPWEGILTVEHSGGAVITRLAVTGPAGTVAPGATQEATFSWSEGQREYGLLKGRSKSELKVMLGGVKPQ